MFKKYGIKNLMGVFMVAESIFYTIFGSSIKSRLNQWTFSLTAPLIPPMHKIKENLNTLTALYISRYFIIYF